MILYIENPKDATRKLLELINAFGKVAGYQINAQKSLAFLYTNDEISEREIKETLPFTTATKRMKRIEDSIRDHWDNIKCTNIQIIRVLERIREKERD